ncbi:putative acyl carrier protein IacP [Caballeronia udeis]|uniref:Putative acyl carrier protein IacP n=1 Tax=Caballeronia udeis TaxID=1232866 RepID=A0A158GNE6_9BURK|nr:acyl carrier protein [Caballeronia udeis]SAL32910.1 putative acyl carrier protein IacP [Caballeronia udeis]
MSDDIKQTIEKVIRNIAAQRDLNLPELTDESEIVDDLGFTSLTVAALIAGLEEELGIDPFLREDVMITDIRTFGDLCRVYTSCLERSQ